MNRENLNLIIGTSGVICYLLLLLGAIYLTYNPYGSTVAPLLLIALIMIPVMSFILGLMVVKTDLEYLKEDLKDLNIRWLE